ncbi:wax ester/triacylglycerol synthase domain-containing protein [Capillimicrobium parvum]|uniref:diacylglycerol O-acyltransferase n=1 Tax=Capillimicrobium parvum TaxID=2884022 RepID=A0A9E6XVZ3_9ACTN|nr:wax ester/triacylglycerol synthase domain-containing protein [Capillimicrobium parvum]UGS34791.1 putative diacylglycerol O-acyltransferase tgs1 [Capillimicrobium parvum]
MDADAIPLTPEDVAILALECQTIAGHTCKVVRVAGEPDLEALRASIAQRIHAAPLLTRRLGGSGEAPAWVPDTSFDLSAHVVPVPVDAPLDEAELRLEVARLFEQRLDRSRPLWRMDVAPTDGGGMAIIWRIHHALADGTAAMRYAQALLWDPAEGEAASAAAAKVTAQHAADEERRRGHLAGFMRREFARSRTRSPFDGEVGTRRVVAFASVPLRELHDAARALADATLNDAVLSIVAGALRRWIEHHHGALGTVRVRVPVSLHHEGDDAGNRDSFFSVALPLNEADPIARLKAVHTATLERKIDHDAETMDELMRDLAKISPRLERFAARVEQSPRRFAVNVSNVPGPRTPVTVLGSPLDTLHSIAEIGERHALRVAVVSACGRLGFGFCADPSIVEDLEEMARGVEIEAAILTA